MQDYLAQVAGQDYVNAILGTFAALLVLVLVLVAVRFFRGSGGGTFVAGGRSRRTRLAVLDATAIDSQRRLVLVRRDETEHLLLIGGPTDVVVESNIRAAPRRAPDEAFDADDSAPEPAPAAYAPPPPRPAAPAARPAAPPPVARAAYGAEATRTPERAPARASTPARPLPAPQPARPAAARPAPAPQANDLDEALLSELDLVPDDVAPAPRPEPRRPAPGPAPQAPSAPASLDDEMARLLGELSSPTPPKR